MILKTKTQKLVAIFVLILVCVFLISIYSKKLAEEKLPAENPILNETITLAVENINTSETVSEYMNKLREEGKITFKSQTYTSMGEFITEINGIKNGEKNWIYYINGKKAEIGVSNYKIKKWGHRLLEI